MADQRDFHASRRTDADRGRLERAGDEVRSWFGDEEARVRRQRDEEWAETARDDPAVTRYETSSRDFARRNHPRNWSEDSTAAWRQPGRAGFSASIEGQGGSRAETYASEGYGYEQPGVESPSRQRRAFGEGDDHYRSWRDRQIAECDRDYEAFCRDRQEKFNADFANWRRARQSRQELPGAPIEDTADLRTEGSPAAIQNRPREGQRRTSTPRRKR